MTPDYSTWGERDLIEECEPLTEGETAHKFDEDGACDECGLVGADVTSQCPNCDSEQKSNDIQYMGDGVYQCPNCPIK